MLPRKLDNNFSYTYEYSVCTLVNNAVEYEEMIESFVASGFDRDSTEFIYADNSLGNNFDAYTAINRFLSEAKGKYIIICHQDILLIDGRDKLRQYFEDVSNLDSSWAILSNAGAIGPNYFSMVITYPNDVVVRKGNPPQRVKSVDENFIVVRSSANLSLSGDLSGFHMYGTDLCIIADFLGYSAYTIPFNLLHKSEGKVSAEFWESKKNIRWKYNQKLRGRWIQTTITNFYISGSALERFFKGNAIVRMVIRTINSFRKKRS